MPPVICASIQPASWRRQPAMGQRRRSLPCSIFAACRESRCGNCWTLQDDSQWRKSGVATQEEGRKTLVLRVIDARPEDIGRGIAKLAPEDLETLGLAIGDMISLMGKRRTVAKAMRTYVKDTNRGFIALDQVLRANAQTALAEQVTVQKIDAQTAQRVVLSPVSAVPAKVSDEELKELARLLEGLPVVGGDKVRPNTAGVKKWGVMV